MVKRLAFLSACLALVAAPALAQSHRPHLGHRRRQLGRRAPRRERHGDRATHRRGANRADRPVRVLPLVSLPVGTYTVAAELTGFKKAVEDGLRAGGRRPPHRRLRARGRRRCSEVVEVTVAGETVNTISGEIARVVDREQVQNMALNGRNYMQLATPHPRRAAAQRQRARHHDRPRHQHVHQRQPRQRQPAHRGRRLQHGLRQQQQPDQQRRHRLHRGGQHQDLELLRGVRPQLGGEHQRGHPQRRATSSTAALYEYHRNEALDANDYFSNARERRQRRRSSYNNFGWSLGGPDPEEQALLLRGPGVEADPPLHATPTLRTLPTRGHAQRRLQRDHHRHPRSRSPGQPFPGNVIPASRITPTAAPSPNLYTPMEQAASSYDDTARRQQRAVRRATTRSTSART